MKRDSLSYLWDVYQSCNLIQKFIRGKNFIDYRDDILLQKAVERCFEIIGEALNRLSRVDPDLANQVPELRKIIGFRNVLTHNYEAIDHQRVWEFIHDSLPVLKATLSVLIQERDPNFNPEAS
ncbi:MAG: DUF86 domain-containing protein [Synechococcales cyanobacterium]